MGSDDAPKDLVAVELQPVCTHQSVMGRVTWIGQIDRPVGDNAVEYMSTCCSVEVGVGIDGQSAAAATLRTEGQGIVDQSDQQFGEVWIRACFLDPQQAQEFVQGQVVVCDANGGEPVAEEGRSKVRVQSGFRPNVFRIERSRPRVPAKHWNVNIVKRPSARHNGPATSRQQCARPLESTVGVRMSKVQCNHNRVM